MISQVATTCVVAFLAVLSLSPARVDSWLYRPVQDIHPFSEEEYYNLRRQTPAQLYNDDQSFAMKLKICRDVLTHEYFVAHQRVDIVDPRDGEMYAELKRSEFYKKFQPDNTTLFINPYELRNIVTRINVLEDFVVESQQEHSVKELVMTCLVRKTDKPYNIQQVFLSPEYSDGRYMFVYNQRGEVVLLAQVDYRDRDDYYR